MLLLYSPLQIHVHFIALTIELRHTREHEMGVTCYFIMCVPHQQHQSLYQECKQLTERLIACMYYISLSYMA